MLWVLMLVAAVPLHRQHRRLDDRRGGPPALADLRADAHQPNGASPHVSAGNALFTLIGFMGMYTVLAHPVPLPGLARDRARPRAVAANEAAGGA